MIEYKWNDELEDRFEKVTGTPCMENSYTAFPFLGFDSRGNFSYEC